MTSKFRVRRFSDVPRFFIDSVRIYWQMQRADGALHISVTQTLRRDEMEPLIVLVVTTTALPGAVGWRRVRSWHVATRGGLTAMYTFTGASHLGAFDA